MKGILFVVLSLSLAACGGGLDGRSAPATPTPVVEPTPTPSSRLSAIWMLGITQDPDSRASLFRSGDFGDTWTTVTEFPVDSRITNVQFLDERTGWAAGSNQIMRTDDGGITWNQTEDISPRLLGNATVHPLSAEVAVALGDTPGRGGTERIPVVFRTTDGGQQWVRVPLPTDVERRPRQSPLQGCITKRGLGAAAAFGVLGPVVLLTSDGGATWSDITATLNLPPLDIGVSTRCIGDSGLWVYGSQLAGGDTPALLVSFDDGRSWANYWTGLADLPTKPRTFFFLDDSTAWAINGTDVFFTPDFRGENRWEARLHTSCCLGSVSFASRSVGIVQGGVEVDVDIRLFGFFTNDGGASWGPLSLPLPPDRLRVGYYFFGP